MTKTKKSNTYFGEHMMRSARGAAWIAVGLLAAGLAACASDVVDIDRTQPNRIDKKIFDGEWYYRPVVLDTQYNQGILFEGLEGDMDRVRWDIREHELIAYRSYELLEGAETGTGSLDFHGNPVAVFPILSHFDVIRDYKPSTGEQSNVLVENTTDRPWWERQYMRVDWSQNLLTDPFKLEAEVEAWSGAPYYVQPHELDNPYRAEVTASNINIVNNYVLSADMWTCEDLGLDPYFCGASDVKMKLSFMKVPKSDYQKLYYPDRVHILDNNGKPMYTDSYGAACDGSAGVLQADCTKAGLPMFERFGFFRTERRAHDDEYQWTRDGRIFLANRWNIWKKSHDGSGTAIPYQYRETRNVTYYLNVDFPGDDDAWEGTQLLATDWDNAFRQTVFELKRQSNPSLKLDDVPTIFQVKKNNCNIESATAFANANKLNDALAEFGISKVAQGNLKRACAVLEAKSDGKFTWEKQGDLRHSFIVWVDTPQNAGPLGYGPLAADPITGETISANANLYGAAIDSYSAYAADIVALMNGDLQLDEVVKGENIRDQLNSRRANAWGDFSPAKMQAMNDQYKQMAKSYGNHWIPDASQASASNQAKIDRVVGSHIERELLVNDDLKRAMLGPDKFQPGQADDATDFSPLAYMTDAGWKRYNQRRIELGAHAIDMADWSDDGMVELASEMAGKTWEEVYALMRKNIYRSVAAHEVGHTLGLRHNFEGSFDALNYQPEFWNYYDKATGTITKVDGTGKHTRAERLMYSTIMDYDARFYADSLVGIGPYDYAAIKFGYGQLVEVFDTGLGAFYMSDMVSLNDYTKIPNLVSGELNCEAGSACAGQNNPVLGPYLNGDDNYLYDYLAHGADSASAAPENIWKRHYVNFDDLLDNYEKAYNGDRSAVIPVVVPYKFCPDEYSWVSNVSCQPYDKGANFLEVTQDRMERYEKYYFFTNFKRDRYSFNDYNYVNSYLSRLVDRYFLPMSNIYRYYLYGFSYMGADHSGNALYLNDFGLGADWQAAAIQGMNYLGSVLEQPEPGLYCKDGVTNTYREWNNAYVDFGASAPTDAEFQANCPAGDQLDVPLGTGKYYYTKWTDEYFYKATRIGTFWDKYAALYAITDNQGTFYRNFSDLLDSGAFSLSYWRGREDEMLDLFGDAFNGGTGQYAWRFDGANYTPAPVVDIYSTPYDYSQPRIESATSWTLRYYSVLFPMARFNSMYDYTEDFATYGRLCLKGYQDCLDIDPAVKTVEYTDPLTGYTYMAAVSPEAVDPADPGYDPDLLNSSYIPHRALAAQLVKEAGDYATQYAGAKTAYEDAVATGTADQQRTSLLQLKEIERGINERSSFLDIIRQLSYVTEYGG